MYYCKHRAFTNTKGFNLSFYISILYTEKITLGRRLIPNYLNLVGIIPLLQGN
jgi:hypothetical protein